MSILKEVSILLGHSKEIVTVDNYFDKTRIVYACLDLIEPYIENVIPIGNEYGTVYDCTIYDFKIDDYINEIIDG